MNRSRSIGVGILLTGILAFTACGAPPRQTGTGESASPVPASSAPSDTPTLSYTPTAVATPDTNSAAAPTSDWSLVPYSTPDAGSEPVLVDDNGSGLVIFGMTPDQFHQRADDLGWSCNPDAGIDGDGFVYTPDVAFRFLGGALSSLNVVDANYQTARGFVVGDTVTQMVQMYGTGYVRYDESDTFTYVYTMPSGLVFWAFVNEGASTVNSWSMSAPGSGPVS